MFTHSPTRLRRFEMPRLLRLRLVLLIPLLSILALFSFDHRPQEAHAQPAKAEWTLMFYFDADCDLEQATIDQLNALLEVGSSKDVHIVCMVDRSPVGEEKNGYTN